MQEQKTLEGIENLEQQLAKMAQGKRNKQAAKLCPEMTSDLTAGWETCVVEKCAWWDEARECCGMLPYKAVVISGGINTHTY